MKGSAAFPVSLFIPVLLLLAGQALYAQWEVRQETIGEGIPSWMAVVESTDHHLLFWVEYPTDGYCIPQAVLKSVGRSAFAYESGPNSRVATVLRFTRERLLQLPGYAANGFIFMWEMEREHFAELLSGFAEEKQFVVSLPGREGEVAGTFGLEKASSALEEACAACEESFFATNDYIFPDSGERLLTKEETGILSKRMRRIAKNEIYARRGYIFKDPVLNGFFRKKKWYRPAGGEAQLSSIEKANAALLAQRP